MPKPHSLTTHDYPGDTDETVAILEWLASEKVNFQRKTRHHIKIGPINYFLGRGTIYIDADDAAKPAKGFEALKACIEQHRKSLAQHTAFYGRTPARR